MDYGKKFEELDKELEPYYEAQSMVPDDQLIYHFKNEYEQAQEALIEAEKKYKGSAARKSGVYGYGPIGKQFGVSAQQMRSWHKEFCPDAPQVFNLKKNNDKKRERLEEKILEERKKNND